MKKLLGILAISALAASAFAQGTVTFWNQTGLVKQWTTATDSTLINVPKNGGFVELFAAPSGTTLANILGLLTPQGFAPNYNSLAGFMAANPGWTLPVGQVVPAAMSVGPGLFTGGTYTIAGITAPAPAAYFAIGWTGSATSLDAAFTSGAFIGESAVFTTATADPAGSPPPTPISTRLTFGGMTLAPIVPEPATFALAGLGLAALLVFRRRN